ncbi:MAG TPA: MFS transporter [Capillimicrobium sp.]
MLGWADTLDVLRLRDLRLLVAAQGVSVVGDRMVSVALAFAVLELGGSAADVGLVLAAASAPLVLSVLAGGVVADRVPRRTVMIGADLLRLVTQGAMAVLLLTGAAEIWTLAALAALTGLGTGFFNPALVGLTPQIVGLEHLQRANAVRASAVAGGEILGPLIAGGLVVLAGPGTAIAVDAATFGVSAACLLALRLPAHEPRAGSTFLADLRGGWDAFRSRRWVWTFALYFGLGNMMWAAWSALGPIVADERLGGAGAWGIVLAGIGVGALAGSVVATAVDPRRPLIVVALVEGLFALPLAFLAGGAPTALLAVAAFLSGAGMMVGASLYESTMQRNVPDEQLSRVSSYEWFGSYLFYPVGMAIWGPLAGAIGLSPTLWLSFGILAALIVALVALPDTRRLQR